MRKALLVVPLLVCGLGWAQQTPSVQVLEVDPPAAATLSAQDFVSVRVAYTSPAECLIWVRPYFVSAEVSKGISHPSPSYSSGSGEAFGWFQIDTANAKEACAIFPGVGEHIHHNFSDPAGRHLSNSPRYFGASVTSFGGG